MSVFKRIVCLFKGHDSSYLFNTLLDDRTNVRDYNIYGCARCGTVYATCEKSPSPTYERWQELAGVKDSSQREKVPLEAFTAVSDEEPTVEQITDEAIKDFLARPDEILKELQEKK